MVLKLKEIIPADESGNWLEYCVSNGSFWITFMNPSGFGESWLIEQEITPADFISACYRIKVNNEITVTANDDLSEYSDTHEFKMKFIKKGEFVKLTHRDPRLKSQKIWSMKLTYKQLTDIAKSLEQYFEID